MNPFDLPERLTPDEIMLRLSTPPGEPRPAPVPEEDRLLTPAEVAHLFRVDAKTVTRWAKAGKLSCIRTLGGHRRYRESEIQALITGGREERTP